MRSQRLLALTSLVTLAVGVVLLAVVAISRLPRGLLVLAIVVVAAWLMRVPTAVEPPYERHRSGPRDATVASGTSRAPGGEERHLYAAQDRPTWARRDPQRHQGEDC